MDNLTVISNDVKQDLISKQIEILDYIYDLCNKSIYEYLWLMRHFLVQFDWL